MTSGSRLDRLVNIYHRTAASRSALAIVAANALLLVGVTVLGWGLWTILVVYWLETGIVGFWTVLRILRAAEPGTTALQPRRSPVRRLAIRVGAVLGFLLDYLPFWALHGFFVFALPLSLAQDGFAIGGIDPAAAAAGGVGMFLGHGAAYLFDYVGRGEYRTTSMTAEAHAPEGRSWVLHGTLLLGTLAIAVVRLPVAFAGVLVALKTLYELSRPVRRSSSVPMPSAGGPWPTAGGA